MLLVLEVFEARLYLQGFGVEYEVGVRGLGLQNSKRGACSSKVSKAARGKLTVRQFLVMLPPIVLQIRRICSPTVGGWQDEGGLRVGSLESGVEGVRG